MSQEMINNSRVTKLSMSFSFNIRFSTLTNCTCLILAHHSLTRLRCPVISWLDYRRLRASKTSDKHEQPKATRLSHHIRTIKVLFLEYYLFLTNQSNRPNRPSLDKLSYSSALMYYAGEHLFYTQSLMIDCDLKGQYNVHPIYST